MLSTTIIIVFVGLIGLTALHEFGHFIFAKIFRVKVEEFGIGYPPRLIGKKFGETIYSLNLLPFGAFVKILGEMERNDDKRSFSSQSIPKRALIAFGGVLSFWLIAIVIFSIVFNIGVRIAVQDSDTNLVSSEVQVSQIAPNSPAQVAGLKIGDAILKIQDQISEIKIDKVVEIQGFTETHLGQEITLTIERGKEILNFKITPRVSPPEGEGPMGVALTRTATKKYPWYQAFPQGIQATGSATLIIMEGYKDAISKLFKGLPTGVQVMGPVGIFQLSTEAFQLGINYFFQFLGVISIYLAIFNMLPIPAADGGKLLFLGIEAVRKRPISQKLEQNITSVSFILLVIIAILVTIKDITRLFL